MRKSFFFRSEAQIRTLMSICILILVTDISFLTLFNGSLQSRTIYLCIFSPFSQSTIRRMRNTEINHEYSGQMKFPVAWGTEINMFSQFYISFSIEDASYYKNSPLFLYVVALEHFNHSISFSVDFIYHSCRAKKKYLN